MPGFRYLNTKENIWFACSSEIRPEPIKFLIGNSTFYWVTPTECLPARMKYVRSNYHSKLLKWIENLEHINKPKYPQLLHARKYFQFTKATKLRECNCMNYLLICNYIEHKVKLFSQKQHFPILIDKFSSASSAFQENLINFRAQLFHIMCGWISIALCYSNIFALMSNCVPFCVVVVVNFVEIQCCYDKTENLIPQQPHSTVTEKKDCFSSALCSLIKEFFLWWLV